MNTKEKRIKLLKDLSSCYDDTESMIELVEDYYLEDMDKLLDSQRCNLIDDYMIGMYNGMILFKSIIDNKEPDFQNISHNLTPIKKEWYEGEHKDSFTKNGFETPIGWEGEILKEYDNNFVGGAIATRHDKEESVSVVWDKEGIVKNGNPRYNLTPIKKAWYEDESNFPCIVVDANNNMEICSNIDYFNSVFKKEIELNNEVYRLATDEEIDKLKRGFNNVKK